MKRPGHIKLPSKQAPTQMLLFLNERLGCLIGHLRYFTEKEKYFGW